MLKASVLCGHIVIKRPACMSACSRTLMLTLYFDINLYLAESQGFDLTLIPVPEAVRGKA